MRIVLDTNIYIAAYLSKGLASQILELGHERKAKLYISPEILSELERKLKDKFKLGTHEVMEFLDLVKKATHKVSPKRKIEVVKDDPDDNIVLECALESKAKIIVSMDRHLIKLKKYKDIAVVHPKTLSWIIPNLLH